MLDDALAEAFGLSGLEKAKEALSAQKIDEKQPGTILQDFTTLLNFIGADGLKTTGKYCMLPQGKLDPLNERMSRPVQHRLKRPQQRSFPHLHGLFVILRASGMGITKGVLPNGRLLIDEALVAQWLDLNPTERYFTLLESWLVQGSGEIVGERTSWLSSFVRNVIEIRRKLKHTRTEVPDERYNYIYYGTTDLVTLALMELFGWVHMEYLHPKEGEGVKPASIERLPLGDAMVALLTEWSFSEDYYRAVDEAAIGTLQPVFQPFFPEWQRLLAPEEEPFREGSHIWRVSLGRVWRRIETPADLDLDELALAILDAFDFDCDHLYCFQVADRRGRNVRYACSYQSEAQAYAEDILIGEVPLPVGGRMTFLFDYGDNWQFDVQLESVDAKKSRLKRPRVIEKKGKAPEQYHYEEW